MRQIRLVPTRAITLLMAVALLVLGASAALAQPGPPDEPGPPGSGSGDAPGRNASDNRSNSDRPGPHGPPAGPQRAGMAVVSDGAVDGRYVQFAFDEEAGTLSGYAVGGSVWFDSVEAPGPFEAKGRGAHVQLTGDEYLISATDNPTGLLRISSPNASVLLILADGVEAQENGSHVELRLGDQIAMARNASVAGGGIQMSQGVFALHGRSVSLVAQAGHASQAKVDEAIADGRVAARFQVLGDNATEVLAYDDVTLATQKLPNGSHRFTVDANFTSGRTFVVDFAPGLVQAGQLGVSYYDEELGVLVQAAITEADDLDDVLTIDPDEGAEYFVVHGMEGMQVLVMVPHFSVHAFEVFSIPPEVAVVLIYGLALGMAVVLVMAMGALVGRRKYA